MNLKPLFDRVILSPEKTSEKSSGGLMLPTASQEKSQTAIIKAVGEGGFIDGKMQEMKVKVGQRVLYTKYAGSEFKINGEEQQGKYILGAVCNTRSVGGIIKLKDEDAQMNDGKFELLCVNYPKSLFEMFKTLRDVKKRRWDTGRVLFKSMTELDVEYISTDYWSLDGEKFISDGKNLHFSILPNAIEILN